MKYTFFRSIRFKALMWYTLVLTATLLAFSSIAYSGFMKTLLSEYDDLLASRADGVIDAISVYLHGDQDKAGHDGFLKGAARWLETSSKEADLMGTSLRISDLKGKEVVKTQWSAWVPNLTPEQLDDLKNGEEVYDTVKGSSPDGKRARYRIYARPVFVGSNVSYIVEAVGPMRLVSLALMNLKFVFFILLPLTLLLALVPAVAIVRLTLKPVGRMIDTIGQITAQNLKLRIHMPDTRDELGRLADTFNGMLERLERSASSQQRFVREIYEDLKTPIAEMHKEIEVARQGSGARDESYRQTIDRLSRHVAEVGRVFDDLLLIAQSEDKSNSLVISKIDLASMAKDAVLGVQESAREKEVSVTVEAPAPVFVEADRQEFARLFNCLIDNAIKFSLRGGSVSVAVDLAGDRAEIAVTDTGIGIPDSDMPYIFDRFYQSSRPRVRGRGFGLGLSIVRTIVSAHKGTVCVDKAEGGGSVFRVTVPVSFQA